MPDEPKSGNTQQAFCRRRGEGHRAIPAMAGDEFARVLSDAAIMRFARSMETRVAVGDRPRARCKANYIDGGHEPAREPD